MAAQMQKGTIASSETGPSRRVERASEAGTGGQYSELLLRLELVVSRQFLLRLSLLGGELLLQVYTQAC